MVDSSGAAAPNGVMVVAPQPAWNVWQRLAFRYALCHALLYALPHPLSNLMTTTASLLRRAGVDLSEAPWNYGAMVYGWLAYGETHWEQGWQWLTSWVGTKALGIEVLHQPTGSGDTAHDYVKFGCIVVLSLLLMALWSRLARGQGGYPRLGRWLYLFARFYLAFWLLTYGSIKLYAGQFSEPGLWRLTREIGDTSPMGMVWTFLGASKPYEVFGGVGEVLAALLLFHRRTALLGSLLAVGVMTNVCALNWLYDVPVKLFSSHLLLFAVGLLAPYGDRLWALLVSNRSSQPVEMAVVRRAWLAWPLALFGWVWVLGTLAETHLGNHEMLQQVVRQRARPELYGLWTVERMLHDGVEVPVTDASRWQFLAIDDGGRAWARTAMGQEHSFAYQEQLPDGTVTLEPQGTGAAATWTVARGQKSVKVPHPAPRTRQDFGVTVDQDRRTLVLTGTWAEKPLELQLVEKQFLLHRGFHWVQEMPFNR